MRQHSNLAKDTAENVVKDIRRATRKQYSAEEKIRIVLEGLRGEDSIAETVTEKPFFREPFKRRRCLIPASGYYEWQDTPGGKQPWYFTARDGSPALHDRRLVGPLARGGDRRDHHVMRHDYLRAEQVCR